MTSAKYEKHVLALMRDVVKFMVKANVTLNWLDGHLMSENLLYKYKYSLFLQYWIAFYLFPNVA